MSLLWLGVFFIVGWVLIIIIHAVSKADAEGKAEMVKDGNNLFLTGVIYFVLNVICYFAPYTVLYWVLFLLAVGFAFLPFFSAFLLLLSMVVYPSQKITGLICSVWPMVMACNILVVYILGIRFI